MKKQIIAVAALLMLSACVTEDTSVCKIMHWCYTPQPKYQEMPLEPGTTPCQEPIAYSQPQSKPCCNN